MLAKTQLCRIIQPLTTLVKDISPSFPDGVGVGVIEKVGAARFGFPLVHAQ